MPIKIDYKRCDGCQLCYKICPMDVFSWDKKNKRPVVAYEGECWYEGACMIECPKRAIDITLPLSSW